MGPDLGVSHPLFVGWGNEAGPVSAAPPAGSGSPFRTREFAATIEPSRQADPFQILLVGRSGGAYPCL